MNSRRPLIGLSGRRKLGRDIARIAPSLADVGIDVYVEEYARSITAAGGLPVYLPLHVDAAEYAGRLDGIVLSGGTDVEPERYGAARHPELHPSEPARDRFEFDVVDVAATADLPVLGICRGLQVLNVWGGGTLHQHVPVHARFDVAVEARIDELEITPGSLLHDLYGARLGVNSLHHQTVDRVADGWVVAARSSDGAVEALEWPGHDMIGVQWHPELLDSRATDPIFAWLVDRARERAGAREPARS
jgi:putative glutamine amidotransferase